MERLGSKGAAYAELLIVLWPMALLWLGIAQIGLLYGADLLVHHAAARAVRAAVVILPDEEDRYNGDEPLRIASSGEGLDACENAPAGGRLDAIRRAARIPLAPISPAIGAASMNGALALFAGYRWTERAVAVTFPDADGGYRTEFEATGPLTARVTYLYRCPVPVVNRILCHPYGEAGLGSEAKAELDSVGADNLAALVPGERRFLALRAERRLPMQGRSP